MGNSYRLPIDRMARRTKSSSADDFIALISMLPWWGGLALAVLSYIVLHRLAASPAMVATRPDQIGQVVASSAWRGLAYLGQFVLPALCLLGALVSILGRKKRKGLVERVNSQTGVGVLDDMSWREFEMLVGEGYRLQGYKVLEGDGKGADGGVDLRLRKGSEKYLVQCKQWKALKVGVQVVRELYGVMAAEGAAGGMVVTSGGFTAEAQAFAQGRNVQLVDGSALKVLLDQVRVAGATDRSAPSASARPDSSAQLPPLCPLCQAAMTRRTARRGANAGNSFWGCSTYPTCKGTQP
jgi:restriction system protein